MSDRRIEIEQLLRLLGSEVEGWRGGKLIATCPFARWTHGSGRDSRPSFAVFEGRGGHTYKCLSCGERGHLPRLLWRGYALGAEYVSGSSLLAYQPEDDTEKIPVSKLDYSAGGKFSRSGPVLRRDESGFRDQTKMFPDVVRKGQIEYLPPDEDLMNKWIAAPPPEYVLYRGFLDVHRAWGLGYNEKERRWVHPIRSVDRKLVGYTSRLCWEGAHCFRCGAIIVGADGKTLHRCGGCNTFYAKYKHHAGPWRRDNLFGIERHVEGEPIVITEGTTDALNLWRHGVRHPVAILGASISTGQAQLIARRTDKVFVMGDGDKAGEIMNSEVERLFFARYNIKVQTIPVADGKDGGSLTLAEVQETMPPAVMLGSLDRANKLDLVGYPSMV